MASDGKCLVLLPPGLTAMPGAAGHRKYTTSAIAIAAALMVAPVLLDGNGASAGDRVPVKLAAIGKDSSPVASPRGGRGAVADDVWLLVQGVLPDASEQGSNGDTVLVMVDGAAPESLEDDIAKEYQLDLVDRGTLPGLGVRVARYRVPDPGEVSVVVDRLRQDRRINRADVNAHYHAPGEVAPPANVARGIGEENVVAMLGASEPESAEEDIAREHGLELVERRAMASLGIRIARYRVLRGRSAAAVLERLRADRRIKTAEADIRHGVPEQDQLQVGSAADNPSGVKDEKQLVSTDSEPERDDARARAGTQPAMPKATGQAVIAAKRREEAPLAVVPRMRAVSAADVLAGGL